MMDLRAIVFSRIRLSSCEHAKIYRLSASQFEIDNEIPFVAGDDNYKVPISCSPIFVCGQLKRVLHPYDVGGSFEAHNL
jgi:hypothetical protein